MKENETWKDIPGYEGLYQASTMGRIRSVDREVIDSLGRVYFRRGKLLSPSLDSGKRYTVRLNNKDRGKTWRVYVLVALTFIGERPEGYHICHKDGNQNNNKLDNLRYDTNSQNQIDIYRKGNKSSLGKLSIDQVLEVRRLYATWDYSLQVIANIFGVTKRTIACVVRRITFKWLNDDGSINDSDTAVS